MHLLSEEQTTLPKPHALQPALPLWKRVPTQLNDGSHVTDFMMLIPKLKESSVHHQTHVILAIQRIFKSYGQAIIFE